jgi:hypothetical protein
MDNPDNLYQQFIRENPDSKVSKECFRQIWMLRQAELSKKPSVVDVPLDEKVIYRSNEEHALKTNEDSVRVENWRRAKKLEDNRALAKLLAKLHQNVGKSCQDHLKSLCSSAMHPTSPTMSMQEFANKTIDMCRDNVVDEEMSLEIELGLREYFANLLAASIESFGSGSSTKLNSIFS